MVTICLHWFQAVTHSVLSQNSWQRSQGSYRLATFEISSSLNCFLLNGIETLFSTPFSLHWIQMQIFEISLPRCSSDKRCQVTARLHRQIAVNAVQTILKTVSFGKWRVLLSFADILCFLPPIETAKNRSTNCLTSYHWSSHWPSHWSSHGSSYWSSKSKVLIHWSQRSSASSKE